MTSNFSATLLVAGEGSRLRPYTLNCPKCLVQVDGVSLLQRQLSVLRGNSSIGEICLVGGYKASMLHGFGSNLIINHRYYETNMLYSLFCAQEKLAGNVLIAYGDIVYSPSILSSLLNSDAAIAVSVDQNWYSYWSQRHADPLSDAETLKLRSDFSISEIGKKASSLDEINGQYMGLIKLSEEGCRIFHSVFAELRSRFKPNLQEFENFYLTDFLQAIIDAGHCVKAIPIEDDWVEVDTVLDLHSQLTSSRLASISAEVCGDK